MKTSILSSHHLPQLLLITVSTISLLTYNHSQHSSSLFISAQGDEFCNGCDPYSDDVCNEQCYVNLSSDAFCDYCDRANDEACYAECSGSRIGPVQDININSVRVSVPPVLPVQPGRQDATANNARRDVRVTGYTPFTGGSSFVPASWLQPYAYSSSSAFWPTGSPLNINNQGNEAFLFANTPWLAPPSGVGVFGTSAPFDVYGGYYPPRQNRNVQTIVRLRNQPFGYGAAGYSGSQFGTDGFDGSSPGFNLNYGNEAALFDELYSASPFSNNYGNLPLRRFPPNINFGNEAVLFSAQPRSAAQVTDPPTTDGTSSNGSDGANSPNVSVAAETTQQPDSSVKNPPVNIAAAPTATADVQTQTPAPTQQPPIQNNAN